MLDELMSGATSVSTSSRASQAGPSRRSPARRTTCRAWSRRGCRCAATVTSIAAGAAWSAGCSTTDSLYDAGPIRARIRALADETRLRAIGKRLLLGVVSLSTGAYIVYGSSDAAP